MKEREVGDYFEIFNYETNIARLVIKFILSTEENAWMLQNITDKDVDELLNVKFKAIGINCLMIKQKEDEMRFEFGEKKPMNDEKVSSYIAHKYTVRVDRELKVYVS